MKKNGHADPGTLQGKGNEAWFILGQEVCGITHPTIQIWGRQKNLHTKTRRHAKHDATLNVRKMRGARQRDNAKCPLLVSDVLLSHGLAPQYHRRSGA